MNRRVLCFGDSNTYGYNPMGGRYDVDTRWPCVMGSVLGDGYEVIEEGLNGRTFAMDDPTEGGFKSGVQYLPPCLMSHNPIDVFVVMLGTNDLKQRFGLNAVTIAHNLTHFVKLVRAYGEDSNGDSPRVLVIAPPLVGDWLIGTQMENHFGSDAPERSRALATSFRRYARLLKCDYLNAADVTQPCKLDAIHLTAEAQRALGTAVANKVLEMIKK